MLRRFVYCSYAFALPELGQFKHIISVDARANNLLRYPPSGVYAVESARQLGDLNVDTVYVLHVHEPYHVADIETCDLLLRLVATRNGSFVVVQQEFLEYTSLPDWPKNMPDVKMMRHDYKVLDARVFKANERFAAAGHALMILMELQKLPFVIDYRPRQLEQWLISGPGLAANRDQMQKLWPAAVDFKEMFKRVHEAETVYFVDDLESYDDLVIGSVKRLISGNGSFAAQSVVVCCRSLSTVMPSIPVSLVEPKLRLFKILGDSSRSSVGMALQLEQTAL